MKHHVVQFGGSPTAPRAFSEPGIPGFRQGNSIQIHAVNPILAVRDVVTFSFTVTGCRGRFLLRRCTGVGDGDGVGLAVGVGLGVARAVAAGVGLAKGVDGIFVTALSGPRNIRIRPNIPKIRTAGPKVLYGYGPSITAAT